MNRIYSYLICAISVISMAACTEELETFSVSLSSADENVEISEDGRNADVTILPEGSTAVVKVTSDTEWQLIDDSTDPYFEVQIDGNDVIISAEEMISSHEHSAKLRIQAGTNAWAYINVTQKGTELSQISLETKKIYFEEWGGVQEIRVMTNKDWYVENKDAVDGITIEEDGDVIRVAAEASLRPDPLVTSFRVVAGTQANNYSVEFEVVQDKWHEPYFSFPVSKATLPATGGRTTIEVVSNRVWTAVSSDPWLKIEQNGNLLTLSNESGEDALAAKVSLTTAAQEGETGFTADLDVRTDDKPLVMKFKIPELYRGNVSVPLMTPFDVYIDWGDGSDGDIAAFDGSSGFSRPDHEYSREAAEYEIKVYGECGSMNGCGCSGIEYLSEIVDWGEMETTNFTYAFSGSALESLPANTKDIIAKATKVDNMFWNCLYLKEIPEDLFADSKLTSISGMFFGCKSLKSIPADFFVGAEELKQLIGIFNETDIQSIPEGILDPLVNLTNLTAMFNNCTDITEIPENLFAKNTELNILKNVFYGTSITEIPENLLVNNVELQQMSGVFGNTDLKTIPENLFANNPKISSASALFAYTDIEEIPSGLFAGLPELSDINSVFTACDKLRTVPTDIFDNNKKLSDVGCAFAFCPNYEGESPYTTVQRTVKDEVSGEDKTVDIKVHLYERNAKDENWQRLYPEFGEIFRWGFGSCFGGCTKLTDYDVMSGFDYGNWVKVPNF